MNAVNFSFTHTPEYASFVLSGLVRADETLPPLTLPGFWTLMVGLQLTEMGDDRIQLSLTLQHTSKQHPVDDPVGAIFSRSRAVLAENFDDTTPDIPFRRMSFNYTELPHNPHADVFSQERFLFTKATSDFPIPDEDEIGTWTYSFQASHIPEPSTWLFLVSGVLLLSAKPLFRRSHS